MDRDTHPPSAARWTAGETEMATRVEALLEPVAIAVSDDTLELLDPLSAGVDECVDGLLSRIPSPSGGSSRLRGYVTLQLRAIDPDGDRPRREHCNTCGHPTDAGERLLLSIVRQSRFATVDTERAWVGSLDGGVSVSVDVDCDSIAVSLLALQDLGELLLKGLKGRGASRASFSLGYAADDLRL